MKANKKYKSWRKEVGGPGEYKKRKEPYMDYPKHVFPDPPSTVERVIKPKKK